MDAFHHRPEHASWGRPRRVCKPCSLQRLGTWNIQGLRGDSAVKIDELLLMMSQREMDVLCIQETHLNGAECYTREGYAVFLSGCRDSAERSYAGVGFIVSPRIRSAVVAFKACDDRIATLRLKIHGGMLTVLSVYAPHNGIDYDIRHTFYHSLQDHIRRTTENSTSYVLGDFNARLLQRKAGEEDIIGPHLYETTDGNVNDATSNRYLLVESCISSDLVIANTFFDHPNEKKVSYRDLGVHPMADIEGVAFAQLDHVLCHQRFLHTILDSWTCREEPINSQHFLMIVETTLQFTVGEQRKKKALDKRALKQTGARHEFLEAFKSAASANYATCSLDESAADIEQAFKAAALTLPETDVLPRRPWTSSHTLDLIRKRKVCRLTGDHHNEKMLNKEIRQSGKQDRKAWLEDYVGTGGWDAVKYLRKPKPIKHADIKKPDGTLSDTAERADIMADYFESVQWQNRFPDLLPDRHSMLGSVLPISTDNFNMDELVGVLKKLKFGKAAGPDDIPSDFWKILMYDKDASGILLRLCQQCWRRKSIPESWRKAKVVLLFKKGDTALPENYRPISLLSVGYKILASLIHQRLIRGGSEKRMRNSQFGFRPGRGTADALMLVRRMIDVAHNSSDDGIVVLMLDWAKAFDRINPAAMCRALRRFGLPPDMVEMVRSIYEARFFFIWDHTGSSSERRQRAGIAQGCPLSPYLFIAVQTIMLHDSIDTLHLQQEPEYVVTRDVLYADDTLLVSRHQTNLQAMLNAIVEEGQRYGLELNWSKTFQLQVSTCKKITKPDGGDIKTVRDAVYLGGLVSCDGRASTELSRRLGEARVTFKQLDKVWSRAAIGWKRKYKIYDAVVLSKLLYSLDSLWLLKADRARLDAFHCKSVRRLLGIPSSYISRVSNDTVLERAATTPLSQALLCRQVSLYKKISSYDGNSFVKLVLFSADGSPKVWSARRRRGRPRQQWATEVHKLTQHV